ncbi:MAG TPA: class I SAM-dependent methyltransferase [Blastocatellia bacterium]
MRLRGIKCLLALSILVSGACSHSGQQVQGEPAGAAQPPAATPQSSTPQTAQPQRPLDVPYVPTPHEVVAEMLRMANVTKNDVVYDLGCGDGRIVIAAAQKHGARGVGIDINPVRVQEAQENAKTAGVTDRVKFFTQDLFETDLSEASVVTLYLLPSVNLKLRPKLLKELKTGTRIVSHSFDMGDWKPDSAAEVDGRKIYYWVVSNDAKKTFGN